MKENSLSNKVLMFLMFAGPAMFAFFAVIIIPFFYGVFLTFTDWDGIAVEKNIIGLANYVKVFQDTDFWNSLLLTVGYVVVSTLGVQVIAFGLAYLLTSGVKAQNFFRAGFFTPNLIGGIVLGFIWQFIFSKAMPAMGELTSIPFLESSFLSEPATAMVALMLVSIWQYSGYMMLIYVAGFAGVPEDVLEASRIDGCNATQTVRHITIPLISQSFSICTFLTLTRCFMVYDLNVSLTNGEPYGSTIMAALHVYEKAFKSRQFGVGQAESLVLFLVVAIVAIVQFYLGKRKEVEA